MIQYIKEQVQNQGQNVEYIEASAGSAADITAATGDSSQYLILALIGIAVIAFVLASSRRQLFAVKK